MWWANVETKPYGGYPWNWDAKILDLLKKADPEDHGRWAENDSDASPYGSVYEGKTIFETEKGRRPEAGPGRVLGYLPRDEEWRTPNLYEDVPFEAKTAMRDHSHPSGGAEMPGHKTWFFYLARLCNHCSYPACLAACPRKAIYKRPEDGIVLIDQERCRGYRKCVEACPYKKAMYRPTTRVSEKCIACYPRVEGKDPETGGRPMETRCMAACIGQIRMQGLVKMNRDGTWTEARNHPLYYMVHEAKVALPLYPQFGTEPNGFYIPPKWVPRPYLRQMFGPGVDQAIENYTNPSRELLAVLQLFRKSNLIIDSYEIEEGPLVYEREIKGKVRQVFDDTVIAFDANRQEIFRTKVEEPFHVRPKDRINWV
jgi:nitrate reductase beta subunit